MIGYVTLNLLLGGEQYAGPFLPALDRQTDTLDVGTSALGAWRLFVASNLIGFNEILDVHIAGKYVAWKRADKHTFLARQDSHYRD